MSRPVATAARTYLAPPLGGSRLGTLSGNKQTFRFRIPLDRHISVSEAYIDVAALATAGDPAFPMYAGAEGLVDTCRAWLGGVSLSEARRHGHRQQLLKALAAGSDVTDSLAALSGAGGAPTQCYTPRLDSVAGDGTVTYGGYPGLDNRRSYARMTSHFGSLRLNTGGAALTNPVYTWRDSSSAGPLALQATASDTAHGAVRLTRLIPELAVMPMGLLPRIPGAYLELHITFDGSWVQGLNMGAAATRAIAQVDGDTLRFVSKAYEFEPESLASIDRAFKGYKAAYWAPRLSERPLAAGSGTSGAVTSQNVDLGFNNELVGSCLLARSSSAVTAAQAAPVSDLRANPLGRADSRLQIYVDNRALYRRPLQSAEKWVETASALDMRRLRPPVGTFECIQQLATGTADQNGLLVYDPGSYTAVINKMREMFAPQGIDLRMNPAAPRNPTNGMPTGRAGLRLRLERVGQNLPIVDDAATLYAWAMCASMLEFVDSPQGLRLEINKPDAS